MSRLVALSFPEEVTPDSVLRVMKESQVTMQPSLSGIEGDVRRKGEGGCIGVCARQVTCSRVDVRESACQTRLRDRTGASGDAAVNASRCRDTCRSSQRLHSHRDTSCMDTLPPVGERHLPPILLTLVRDSMRKARSAQIE